jgi:NADH-quinone oxidoreductase subunit N
VSYTPADAQPAPAVAHAATAVIDPTPSALSPFPTAAPLSDQARALAPAREFLAKLLALIAAVTCTFGNLAAYGQTDIKRLLAYSTIAQAGYMIMPVAAALLLVDKDPAAAENAIAALAFYMGVYLFMKLGSFAVVALVRNAEGSEKIADYAGLVHRAPVTAICFVILLLSLIGIPPLGGFFAKFFVFASLYDAGLIAVLVVAGLNTALSLFYYLRVVKVMTFDRPMHDRPLTGFSAWQAGFVAAMTAPVVWWGVSSSGLQDLAHAATRHLY